jgi:REP element-mobilizing transposase RayT
MTYNPDKHHRRSIRLKGYDYSQAGLYFITICIQNRACLFGKIENGVMILNDAGRMVEKWFYELGNKYPDKCCHEMVVMPNHFHCIIENKRLDAMTLDNATTVAHVGAPLRGRPENVERGRPENVEHACPENDQLRHPQNQYGIDNKKYGATIGNAMDWFKTMTTNEYIRGVKKCGWQQFDGKLWQRNYWEHIIRNEMSYMKISDYILSNPIKWDNDALK